MSAESDKSKLAYNRLINDYIAFYESLGPRRIDQLDQLAEPDIIFKDPFNYVKGTDRVKAIFHHMFDALDNPKFKVLHQAWADKGDIVYLRWHFSYTYKTRRREIEGASEVHISPNGKIAAHYDFWDAGEYFYEHIPVLGSIIRAIRKKLAV